MAGIAAGARESGAAIDVFALPIIAYKAANITHSLSIAGTSSINDLNNKLSINRLMNRRYVRLWENIEQSPSLHLTPLSGILRSDAYFQYADWQEVIPSFEL